ncbi:N-acetyltransferase 9-like protein [Strongylocentrotus purpuratus]|uniref:N-acetyltransferase 9-like protein n=1 Tax=Strongylocentrotus purpuratus TaxID=7668 RepID=A0A7M7PAI2_STRPU|nr:N-acetyltransferase 9-like protein [Strongylocentrotus purpuratus]XP_030848404.1 N-acetyltransferase 9-like protein [Strongylocentrotus purpuratus]
MRINESTCIIGTNVVLVPYKDFHVPRYHEWMKSTELQELTASEPLSLEEEYEMQKSWFQDENKCTFIMLDKSKWSSSTDEIESMCGDVNLFFNDPDEPSIAEIEIMVAESSSRGKGFGKEALLIMMHYGMDSLKVSRYVAKIGEKNKVSLGLFKKLGFQETSVSKVFQEVTLELEVKGQFQDWLREQMSHLQIVQYTPNR